MFVINWTHILGTFDGRLTGITKGRLGLFLRGMYDVFPSSAPSSLLVEYVRGYQSLFEKNSIPEQNDQVAFVLKHSSNAWLTLYDGFRNLLNAHVREKKLPRLTNIKATSSA